MKSCNDLNILDCCLSKNFIFVVYKSHFAVQLQSLAVAVADSTARVISEGFLFYHARPWRAEARKNGESRNAGFMQ